MDDLNPKARALVDAGRSAFRATERDRERIEAALRLRLGSAALPPDMGAAHVAGAAGRRAAWLGGGAGAVVVIGVALLVLRPGTEAPRPGAARSTQSPATSPAPLQAIPARSETPEFTPAASAVEKVALPVASVPKKAASSHGSDRLAQEVALMSRATAELRTGHAANALRALAEHQRKFPNGALREDRRTAKAQALCLLGQLAKGRAELALLPAQSPGAARAEQVCDASALSAHAP